MVSAINQHKEPVDISQSEEIQQLKTNIKRVKDDINDKQEETKNWGNKNQELSRKVSNTADTDQGVALALMGVGLTMLAKDLLVAELLDHANSHTPTKN